MNAEKQSQLFHTESASSPGSNVEPSDHAGQQDPFEQPRLRVHVHDGAHAPEQSRAEQKLQEDLRNADRTLAGQQSSRISNIGCVCVPTAHPVSIDDPQAARVGANPLLFDVVEHVNEQRTADLVGQVNGRVTLKRSKVYVQ